VSFCAICTDETTDLVKRPLGKDDALVNVCNDCDTTKPVAKMGPERGFEPSGGSLNTAAINRGASNVFGAEKFAADNRRLRRTRMSVRGAK